MHEIKDRIKEFRRVPAKELTAHANNWRKHSKKQQAILKGIVEEVGFAGAVLAREDEHGNLYLIDGHLRTETFADETLPVLVLDVNEQEANKILATYDPISAMAESDATQLDQLLRDVQTSNQDVADMLDKLAQDAGIVPPKFEPTSIDEQGRLDEKNKTTCPECGHEF